MAKVRFTLRARLQMQSAHANNKDLSQSGPMAMQTFNSYGDLPQEYVTQLLKLEDFIGDVDGKDTVLAAGEGTFVDDGTIDADDAVKAFNDLVFLLRSTLTK